MNPRRPTSREIILMIPSIKNWGRETDMHKIYNLIFGQTNEQFHEKAALDATYQDVKADQDPIRYLKILNNLCFSNKSKHHPIRYLLLTTKRLYNTTHHADKNMTNFLVRFRNTQKVKNWCNGSLISKLVQNYGVKVKYPLHTTGFDTLADDENKKAKKNRGRYALLHTMYR